MDIFSEIFSNRWVYLIFYFLYFLLFTGMSNEIMYFFFFADKPKSFRRKYKKEHSFFYRFFLGFVFHNEYMRTSKFYKYIVKYYILYSSLAVMYICLFFFSCLVNEPSQNQIKLFGLIMIILWLIPTLIYIWTLFHSKKGPGFHWILPTTWRHAKFYMDLSGCDENGHIKKTSKKE